MEKLTQTGNWIWRDGELSYAEFGRMDRTSKDEHLQFLSSLSEEDISTNDWYILNQYAPQYLPTTVIKKFLSIDDDFLLPEQFVKVGDVFFDEEVISTEEASICAAILDKDELENYLNKYFHFENVRWRDDLRWALTVEKFIENTSSYMKLDDLTISYIKEYKKLI
jgi:hypothetical protein